jgi:nitroreductase
MTNDMIQLIKTRRSFRSYLPKQVEQEKLDAVLEAGTWAPTGIGAQCPVIIAVQDPETRETLSKMNAQVMGTTNDPYYGAPTIVLVLADPERGTWVEDGSCVLVTMMQAAHSLGLASCWIHRERQMFDSPEGKALLKKWGLPETLRGVGSLALGYNDGPAPDPKPRKEGYIVKIL